MLRRHFFAAIGLALVLGTPRAAWPDDRLLVILAPTGQQRDGLPVLTRHPDPSATEGLLTRGFSGRLVRLYALEQEYLRRKTGSEPEPAYLLLSDRQGGFPEFGFYLDDVRKDRVGWVDLHRDSTPSGRFGTLDQIFPHELMHVIVRQLAGEVRESGGNQVHAIGVRTDPVNAFGEGFGETMQVLAVDDPDAVADTKALAGDLRTLERAERAQSAYARDLARAWWPVQPSRMRFLFWFNQAEQVLRYHYVKANRFARAVDVPAGLLQRRDKYGAYLYANVVAGPADGPPKPAAVLLSSEGVVAHLLWRVAGDPALQQRAAPDGFYEQFGVTRADVAPIENVFLKIFAALHEGRPATAAELLRAYARLFPDDGADVDRIVSEALLGQALPEAPEVWLANDELMTGTSLFDQYRALPRPHTFDANAATTLDWMSVGGVTAGEAARLVAGAPYADVAAVADAAPPAVRPRIAAMSAAMTRLLDGARSGAESLSLTRILLAYAWRLLLLLAATTAAGAMLARLAGVRRWWVAGLVALAASVLVVALAWVVTSPASYPFLAPLVVGGVPWAIWRGARRRSPWAAAQAVLAWAVASVPALVATLM